MKGETDPEKEIVIRVCEVLTAQRESKEISQRKLSELTSLSPTGLRHIESGETSPTLFSLLKICDALDLKLSDLLVENGR